MYDTLNFDMRGIGVDVLTPYQCALIELRKAMQDIRALANRIRLRPWMRGYHNGDFLLGRLDGIRFSWATLLIFQTADWDEFRDQAEAFMSEANFLLGPYINRSEV